MIRALPHNWLQLLTTHFYTIFPKDFIRLFIDIPGAQPQVIFAVTQAFKLTLQQDQQSMRIHSRVTCYIVGFRSKLLQPSAINLVTTYTGHFGLAHIVSTTKGSRDTKTNYLQYRGLYKNLNSIHGDGHAQVRHAFFTRIQLKLGEHRY